MLLVLTQIFSISSVVLSLLFLKYDTYNLFYTLILNLHYVVAVLFITRMNIDYRKFALVAVPGALFITAALWSLRFPVPLYFGFHWFCAETFLFQRGRKSLVIRTLFLVLLYSLYVREDVLALPVLAGVPAQVKDAIMSGGFLAGAMALLLGLQGWLYWNSRGEEQYKFAMSWDLIYMAGLGVLVLAGRAPTMQDIGFIHVLQFIYFYLLKEKPVSRFHNVGVALLFCVPVIAFSHLYVSHYGLNDRVVNYYNNLFGFVHFSLALFISRANPAFFRKYFHEPMLRKNPEPAARESVAS